MKISIFKNNSYAIGIDYSDREDCLGVFEITETEIDKLKKGCTVEIVDEKLVIIETEEYNNIEKVKELGEMTLDELLVSTDNFSSLLLEGKEIWQLLSDKFFWGNIYKELQLHRIMLQKLLKVVVKGETLTEEDLLIIQWLEEMDTQAETVLAKFKTI